MAKSYFSEEFKKSSGALTPETIVGKLMYFRDQAHLLHFNTHSFAEHKMLDGLYSAFDDWVDKVGELLLGYIAPERFGDVPAIKVTSLKTSAQLIEEMIQFSHSLDEYAEEYDWEELCNFAADIEGDAQKAKYLSTLK
jgi:DNA-binding ferritin-like protein